MCQPRAHPGYSVLGAGLEALTSDPTQWNPHGDSLAGSLPFLFQMERRGLSNVHLVPGMDINPPTHPAPRYRYRTFPLNVTASSERDSGWWERRQAEEDPPVTQQLHNINFQDPHTLCLSHQGPAGVGRLSTSDKEVTHNALELCTFPLSA